MLINKNNETTLSPYPEDWSAFYAELHKDGMVPDVSCKIINQNNTIFRGMYQNLSDILKSIRDSRFTPILTTIYADVLVIPDLTDWLLQSAGLVILARRIEVTGSAKVTLDYQQNTSAQLVVFASEISGTLSAFAVKDCKDEPKIFNITQDNVSPGILIANKEEAVVSQTLSFKQGLRIPLMKDMLLYLNNAFSFASLLYDQNQSLALSILLWLKGWAAQSHQLEELFYSSTSLATLLTSEINNTANGAAFVPYLTSGEYVGLANAFASEFADYEGKYEELRTREVFTKEKIDEVKTMAANIKSEEDYIDKLLEQINGNYDNAEATAKKALENFQDQKQKVEEVKQLFEEVGIPDYEQKQKIKAFCDLAKAVVEFGAAVAIISVGGEAAAPALAEGAVKTVEEVANAAKKGSKIAELAKELKATMKKL